MYCSHCGKEIRDDAAFCPYCGTAQGGNNETSAGTKNGQTNDGDQAMESSQADYAGQTNAGQTNAKTAFTGRTHNQEVDILQAHLHWVTLMPFLPIAVVVLIASAFGGPLIVFGLIAAVIIMIDPIIKYATTTVKFTNKRLIGKQGFLKTQDLDAPLNKINNVYVNSDMWGKIFGYGALVISTSSGEYKYQRIQKPEDFKNALMKQIDQFENDQIREQAMQMAAAMNSAMNGFDN